MTAIATEPRTDLLTTDLLATFRQRAAGYDRDNRFFSEDFEDLKRAGYLNMAVPEEFGGLGYTLDQTARQTRLLAEYAPATALAVNMHVYWTGIAADLLRMGDTSLEWLLREAGNGEVFAAGHGEVGNDQGVFLSTVRAERVEGGYKFYGHKIFGSLSPVWTRLGLHGMDTSDPENPKIVHAFMPRDTEGYTIKHTWDVLGMRATASEDTILDGAFVPDRYIGRILPAGGADAFMLGLFAWGLGGFCGVYTGLAKRAIEIAVETAHKRTSIALTRSFAYHPEVQHNVSEMTMRFEAMNAQFERLVDDWSAGVEYGNEWPLKIVAAKHNIVEGAKDIVDRAMSVSGG